MYGHVDRAYCVRVSYDLMQDLYRTYEAFYDRGSPYCKFSEAPHLRRPILIVSHPNTDCSKNPICIPMNNPMDQAYKNVIFRNKNGIPTSLG